MMEVLAGVLLVLLGVYLGRKQRPERPEPMPEPAEREQTLLQEDRAAFAQLMGYCADRAYGLYEEE